MELFDIKFIIFDETNRLAGSRAPHFDLVEGRGHLEIPLHPVYTECRVYVHCGPLPLRSGGEQTSNFLLMVLAEYRGRGLGGLGYGSGRPGALCVS